MIKILKMWFYKYMARIHYNSMHDECDRMSCGMSLARHINPRVVEHENRMNYWIDKCKSLEESKS